MVSRGNPLQASGTMDYAGMVKIIKYLLDAAWGENWGKFTPEAPNITDPNNIQYPHIVHYLDELQPGLIGKSTRELKPRVRHYAKHDDVNGTQPPATTIYGRVLEGVVKFEIWEETNEKVEKAATDFRQFIDAYTGYLKEKGLENIIFLKLSTESMLSTMRDDHKIRCLSYHVRFEEISEVPTDIIRNIQVVEERLRAEMDM